MIQIVENPLECARDVLRSTRRSVAAAAVCLVVASSMILPGSSFAKDATEKAEIVCLVTDGQGMKDLGRRESPGFSQWVFKQEGVGLGDDIRLYWEPKSPVGPLLRVALDNPVPKQAQLVSITDDTVSAVVMTSDSETTRSWHFAINFRLKRVMASGLSSNTVVIKGQIMTLSCDFQG